MLIAPRIAGPLPAAAVDADERALLRVALPASKYFVCKRAPVVVAEALECLGGNGYVEENGLARLYREAPLNSIWEGSGNVNALDVLRALGREPQALEAFVDELGAAAGADRRLDTAVAEVKRELEDGSDPGTASAYRGAAPFWQSWQGLRRYWDKQLAE